MSLYVICYELMTLQKDTKKNENSNCIILKCIFLLCTRSELDILLLHVLDQNCKRISRYKRVDIFSVYLPLTFDSKVISVI